MCLNRHVLPKLYLNCITYYEAIDGCKYFECLIADVSENLYEKLLYVI